MLVAARPHMASSHLGKEAAAEDLLACGQGQGEAKGTIMRWLRVIVSGIKLAM